MHVKRKAINAEGNGLAGFPKKNRPSLDFPGM